MSLDRDIDLLRNVLLFSEFSADQLRLLAFSAEKRTLRAESVLFRAGERADTGFVVIKGTVELQRAGKGGAVAKEQYGPGSLIGELALVTQSSRSATAVAIEDVEVIAVRRATFRRMLQEYPELAAGLQRRMVERLKETNDALRGVRDRLLREY